jgi:hypothetical protein
MQRHNSSAVKRARHGRSSRPNGTRATSQPTKSATYQLAAHDGLEPRARETLDAAVQLEVLPDGEQLQQRVELRAVADAAPDVALVRADAEAVDVGLAAGGRELTGQDGEGRCLAGAVDTYC